MDPSADYCTLWPDVWFGTSLKSCCLAHDLAYAAGVDKFVADIDLAKCVAETGLGWLALLMLAGLSVFGWFFYPRRGRP